MAKRNIQICVYYKEKKEKSLMLLSEDTKKKENPELFFVKKSTNILISFHCRFEYVCFLSQNVATL